MGKKSDVKILRIAIWLVSISIVFDLFVGISNVIVDPYGEIISFKLVNAVSMVSTLFFGVVWLLLLLFFIRKFG